MNLETLHKNKIQYVINITVNIYIVFEKSSAFMSYLQRKREIEKQIDK